MLTGVPTSPGFIRLSQVERRCLKVSASLAGNPGESEKSSPREVNFSRRTFQVWEWISSVCQIGDRVRDLVEKPQTPEEKQLLTALKGRMMCAGAPILLAAISQSVNTPLTVVASGMAKWLELYSGVLMVRVLLSWFPNIPWERQPLQAMRDMCDPYLNLFRNIIPPLFNALDLSPMLAFLVLGVLTSILNTTVQAG